MNTRIFNELDSQISITFHKGKHVCEAVTEDVTKFAKLNFNGLTIFMTKNTRMTNAISSTYNIVAKLILVPPRST